MHPQVDAEGEQEGGGHLEQLEGLEVPPQDQHLGQEHGEVHQEGEHTHTQPRKDEGQHVGQAGHRAGAQPGLRDQGHPQGGEEDAAAKDAVPAQQAAIGLLHQLSLQNN